MAARAGEAAPRGPLPRPRRRAPAWNRFRREAPAVIDDVLRDLAARMARDPRVAASIVDRPDSGVPRIGLSASDLEVLGILADARAAGRLRRARGTRGAP